MEDQVCIARREKHDSKRRQQVRQPVTELHRNTNPRQRDWRKTIHRAKLEVVSTRAIARNLGMSRNTVRKYLAADSPEMVGAIVKSRYPDLLPRKTTRKD